MIQVATKLQPEQIRDLVGPAPVIVEIGAHEGEDSRLFLEAMPRARLFCFEPERRVGAALAKNLKAYGERVTICCEAVGATDGYVPFYASTGAAGGRVDWTLSGSIRRPTGHLIRSPEIRFKSPEMVPCIRLDTWLGRHPEIDNIELIWADVQGAQRDLIEGGRETLGRSQYLYIECHQQPLYDGEPTQEELLEMLKDLLGFQPLACHEGYNFLLVRDPL